MFNKLSIRFKLIVLLGASAAIALLISSALTLYSTYVTEKVESLRQLKQLAGVSSENLRAALAFRDDSSALRILSPLQANPHILAAVIEDESGKPFSGHFAHGMSEKEIDKIREAILTDIDHTKKHSSGIEQMTFNYMYVIQPIIFEDKPIGTLSIISDTSAIHNKMVSYIRSQALISIVTIIRGGKS